jgi:putative PIN family toxin of toxin-antitoxin system
MEVFCRPKLERYISKAVREAAIERIRSISTWIEPSTPIRACRDPRDDKFLEVAVHGRADLIVTGDADLLALNPFRGIAILTPAEYLELK